jgi:hypothetical protein
MGEGLADLETSTPRYEPLSKETRMEDSILQAITQVQGKRAAKLGVVWPRAPPASVICPESCCENIDSLGQYINSF